MHTINIIFPVVIIIIIVILLIVNRKKLRPFKDKYESDITQWTHMDDNFINHDF